ncbi:[Pyruvate dehydrogenase [lipoamide]] kinase, mitochondrial [Papilio xuthus]|uniref:[Pyruvate dehydrogenase [lipoamide]] kinase, mitochondrial n=1 Tax=Papilio xuthus TaxID=66420 RepID=A0A0N1ICX6_PAPXU|nr:[Pyruvate dehydrogenase [lipoamide]] kinase, mitochondrial [Papilio xuthus]
MPAQGLRPAATEQGTGPPPHNLKLYSTQRLALSNEANELLPVFNRTSSKFYKPMPTLADWSGSLNTASNSQCARAKNREKLSPSISHGL